MQLLSNGDKIAQMTQFDIHTLKVLIEIINILDRIFAISYSNYVTYVVITSRF